MSHELTLNGVRLAYGPAVVAEAVDLTMQSGNIVAILGANGAGKTTLARAISGLLPVRQGAMTLNGADITGFSTRRRVKAGIALVAEERWIFPGMSVADNLLLGTFATRSRSRAVEEVTEVFPILHDLADQKAGLLSGGEQQMLAIGRALMSSPSILILDEPSLGLAPKVTSQILSRIKLMADDGLAVLLIEQNLFAALDIATSGAIFERGRLGPLRTAADLRSDPGVRDSYLGRAS